MGQMWIDKKFPEKNMEERLKCYLAYVLPPINTESLDNLTNGILYITGHLTEQELRARYPKIEN